MTFAPKMPKFSFRIQNLKYWTIMHLRNVKFESGGQKVLVIKTNLSANSLNLAKSSFLPKSLMLNSYTTASLRSFDSTINKRKDLCIHCTARKRNIFIKKSKKIQLFDLKFAYLNRYTFESTKIEIINSKVIKIKDKFFYIPYVA